MIPDPLKMPRVHLPSHLYSLSLSTWIHLLPLLQVSVVRSEPYLPWPWPCIWDVCSQKVLHAIPHGPGQQMNLAQLCSCSVSAIERVLGWLCSWWVFLFPVDRRKEQARTIVTKRNNSYCLLRTKDGAGTVLRTFAFARCGGPYL